MKNKTWLLMVVLSLALTSVASANEKCAMGKSGGYGHGQKDKSNFSELLVKKAHLVLSQSETLNLSKEQIQQIEALKLQAQKDHIRHKADVKTLNLDIRSKLHDSKIDVEAVHKLIDQKYEAKKAMDKNTVESIAKFKGVLDDKQKETLKALKKDWKKKMV